ncbi:hypothetical protein V6W11_00485 [Micromonospora profundi]|uniref:hypothetical protein n=1 Tax=Micromonospora TaxID=1873 RepID=UPI000A60B677|nr:hypothetical protein [Micromonospora sp. NRRL B-16802]
MLVRLAAVKQALQAGDAERDFQTRPKGPPPLRHRREADKGIADAIDKAVKAARRKANKRKVKCVAEGYGPAAEASQWPIPVSARPRTTETLVGRLS